MEFADTDMAGIVHFARFFVFMETAEHQLREALGFPVTAGVLPGEGDVPLGWPRVSATCDYKSPARLGDELEIRVAVRDRGTSSLTFGFSFHRGDSLVAVGEMTSVCCRLAPEVRPVPIPPELIRAIAEAEHE